MIKLIGRDPDCDLVIQQTGVAEVHARLELTDNGHVYLLDAGSDFNTHLNRNEQWVRIHKIQLCVADRIRLGEHEIGLSELLAVFGKRDDIRLGDEHFSRGHSKSVRLVQREQVTAGKGPQRPRRNPLTGKIERDPPDYQPAAGTLSEQ